MVNYYDAGLTSFDMADIYGPAESIYGKHRYKVDDGGKLSSQGSTLRKDFTSPAGLVTVTFTSPEIFLLSLILIIKKFK